MLNKKGFTLVEVLFVSIISVVVVGAILSVWLLTQKVWTGERKRTDFRVGLMQALETVKNDLRLSSITYIAFYPAGGGPYAAVSMPVAETDANNLLTLNANGEIDWDKTVIYHIFTETDGTKTLRRTVYDPRDNTMTDDARYAQLAGVVTAGAGGTGSATDTEFLKDVDTFEISSLAPIVDFYEDSTVPVRVGKVVFGWTKLSAGNHTIRFEITGKNDSSSGYDIGIDTLMIEPSGSAREVEYYISTFAPDGALTVSGGSASRVHDTIWSNDNYLKFAAVGIGDYVEILDYYDLWRESAFESSVLSGTEKVEEEVRIKLNVPQGKNEGEITWFANVEAGDSEQEGRDGDLPAYPITIRTVVSNINMDTEGDFVRVRFKSSLENPLRISRACITRRSAAANGLVNVDPTGLTVSEYHMHQQLFFRDEYDMDGDGSTTDMVKFACVPPNSEVWSEWTAFPLVLKDADANDVDYFITFCIPDLETAVFPAGWDSFNPLVTDCKYWQGSSTRSYYITGDYATVLLPAAGTPDWSGYTVTSANNIYVTANIDTWKKAGTVESQILDTAVTGPAYGMMKWSEQRPAGTGILLKARSSESEYMVGAAAWDSIAGSGVNPHSLDVGAGRYVQFLAELSTTPFWEVDGTTLSYEDYIALQAAANPYDFPESGGEPYVTGTSSSWVDDIEIDWPGDARICTITGYVAKKSDYGQAKVTVDGAELTKILSVHVIVSGEVCGKAVVEENIVEVEPRNTGK